MQTWERPAAAVLGPAASPLTPQQVGHIVRQAAKRVGIEAAVSPHWLRHAHASHNLDRGTPIHLVQATLGHASVATTGRYLHARPNDLFARAIYFVGTDVRTEKPTCTNQSFGPWTE